jgi:hypothetical protein
VRLAGTYREIAGLTREVQSLSGAVMAKKARAKSKRAKSKRAKSTRAKSTRAKTTRAKKTKRSTGRRWSQRVTERSDALDLEGGVFKLNDPKRIAASLKRSAERSKRRKANPYRSALSMLTFYHNRAGRTLPASRKRKLEQAKDELRVQFGRA